MKKLFLVLLTTVLAGCVGSDESLSGGEYKADSGVGVKITLGFDKKGSGFHGQVVNNYFGSYKIKDGKIKFSLAGSTMMAAPDPMMKTEMTYFQFLDKAISYQIKKDKLIISTPDKTMIFEKNDGE